MLEFELKNVRHKLLVTPSSFTIFSVTVSVKQGDELFIVYCIQFFPLIVTVPPLPATAVRMVLSAPHPPMLRQCVKGVFGTTEPTT